MTPLETLIHDEIARDGPMRLDRYMEFCLAHPEHGYYPTRDPLGAAGDFVTAPEVSQIFGELIGLWLAQVWVDQGRPAPVRWIELGPGRGTLAADAARALRQAAPDFLAAAELVLVETSPALRARQAERLSDLAPRWADTVDDALSGAPAFLVANEFFDALPIRQFRRVAETPGPGLPAWTERHVALVEGALTWRDLPGAPPEPLAARLAEPAEGAVLEACPAGEAVAAAIGRALAERGTGAALLIDYGYDDAERRAAGGRDTFQAARRHEYADPLAHPGEADLTAHVDFDALARAARPANAWGAVGQGSFLRALGAEPRAAQLARANPARAEAVAAGLHRLTHPAEMGRLFKAMALTPPNAPPPPGLTAAPKAPEGAG